MKTVATARPACTFVQVARFIDPQWLVELEIDAVSPVVHGKSPPL